MPPEPVSICQGLSERRMLHLSAAEFGEFSGFSACCAQRRLAETHGYARNQAFQGIFNAWRLTDCMRIAPLVSKRTGSINGMSRPNFPLSV